MKRFFSLLMIVFAVTSMIFAAEGGKLTSSKTPIDPTETATLTYDGAGTNFANWEPKCFVHAWLEAADGKTLSKEYTTAWASCNSEENYAALDAKVKMTFVSKGKYTIDINIKNFFDVAEADLENIGKLGIIVRAQYEGDNNKTDNMFINVAVPAGGGEGGEEIKTKALEFVPGVWTTDDAVLAVWSWGKEAAGAWAKFAGTGDTLVANINEKADSVIFVRFKNGIEPTWEDQDANIWNKTEDLLLNSCAIYFVNDWGKYSWCDAETGGGSGEGGEGGEGGEEIKTKALEFVPGVWTTDDAVLAVWAWGKEAAGAFAKFAGEGDTLVANINEKADSVIFVRFKNGIEPTWEDQDANIWNKTEDLLLNSCAIYFVNDWGKYSWCDAETGGGSGEGGEGGEGGEEIKTKALEFVPGVWTTDDAVLAVWSWGKEAAGAWAKFAGEGDTLVANINEKADSVIFVRFKNGIEPTWEDQDANIWNKTEDLLLNSCAIYFVNDWGKYSWCDAETGGGELPAIYETMKLVPGIWNVDGAKFAVFTWGKNVKAEWSEFFAGTGDTLSAQINGNADSLVLVRFAGTVDAPTWENESENVWNKIDKILINHESLVYTVVNWADGQWTPYIPLDLVDGYYLVGTHNDWWNPTSADLFSLNTEAEGEEYQLSKTLTVGQGIKVAQVKDKEIIHWFQDDSYGNEYVVDAEHAGEVTIYFRPNHDGGEQWTLLEGYIFIVKNSATAIDNAEGDVPAVKVFRDGQLLIIKGEKVYNVMGAVIR